MDSSSAKPRPPTSRRHSVTGLAPFVLWGALLAYTLAATVVHRPVYWPDAGYNAYCAWMTGQGLVPHRDFWESHPPGLYLVLAPLLRLVGFSHGFTAACSIGVALVLALLCAHATVRLANAPRSLGMLMALAVATIYLNLSHTVWGAYGVRFEDWVLLFGLSGLHLILVRPKCSSHLRLEQLRLLLAGCLCGIGVLCKPAGLAPLAAAILACIWPSGGTPLGGRARTALLVATGSVIPVVVMVTWLGAHGGLRGMLVDLLGYLPHYIPSCHAALRRAARAVGSNVTVATALAVVPLLASHLRRRSAVAPRGIEAFAFWPLLLAWLVLESVMLLAQRTFYSYTFMNLHACLLYVGSVAFGLLWHEVRGGKPVSVICVGLGILLSLSYVLLWNAREGIYSAASLARGSIALAVALVAGVLLTMLAKTTEPARRVMCSGFFCLVSLVMLLPNVNAPLMVVPDTQCVTKEQSLGLRLREVRKRVGGNMVCLDVSPSLFLWAQWRPSVYYWLATPLYVKAFCTDPMWAEVAEAIESPETTIVEIWQEWYPFEDQKEGRPYSFPNYRRAQSILFREYRKVFEEPVWYGRPVSIWARRGVDAECERLLASTAQ